MRRPCLILLGFVLITALTAAADSFDPLLLQANEKDARFVDVTSSFMRTDFRGDDSFSISTGTLADDHALLVNHLPDFNVGTGQGFIDDDECRFCSLNNRKLLLVPATNQVPEPTSLVLLALGILGIEWPVSRTRQSLTKAS